MAHHAQQYENMKNGMYKFMLRQGINYCTGDVENATDEQPKQYIHAAERSSYFNGWLDGNEDNHSHQNVGSSFEMTIGFQGAEIKSDTG